MMPSRLAQAIQSALDRRGLSRKAAVAAMGWRNQAKGLRRLDAWLTGEAFPVQDQVRRLAAWLEMTVPQIQELVRLDRAALQREADAARALDPRYRLDLRLIPGIYVSCHIILARMNGLTAPKPAGPSSAAFGPSPNRAGSL